ncbi:hypothetical protein QYE76_055255 [Lolium multiflorum]|uniref:Uncharacterized protein n=1 Tax=Lolium multiflorum TaxID=4521 RepID=A0AAD8SZD2_LOLMU|nr:hypothetical protein QYE76_055255 [Lolium multiflorum]
MVWAPCRLLTCPSAYLSLHEPQSESHDTKTFRDVASIPSRGIRRRLRHPAGEGNHLPEDSTPPWSPPFHVGAESRVAPHYIPPPSTFNVLLVLLIHFEDTNNMAKYEALLHGLREIEIKHIICCGDSDLVAQQVVETWNARNSVIAAYKDEVDEIAKPSDTKSNGTCRGCQYYATQPNAPAQELKTISITWLFAVWGLDMVGKLKKSSPGSFEYLLVAVDKFRKWIKAKPMRRADGAT